MFLLVTPQPELTLNLNRQDCLRLHIRIIWNLLNQDDIPYDPDPEVLRAFAERFGSEAELQELILNKNRPLTVNPDDVQLPNSVMEKNGSRIVSDYRKIDHSILQFIRQSMARVGMVRWGPDLRQSPNAHYNLLCRNLAINTFQQALTIGAYQAAFDLNERYLNDGALLIKLYNSIVHSFFKSRYQRQVTNPGSVARTLKKSPAYKQRDRVCGSALLSLHLLTFSLPCRPPKLVFDSSSITPILLAIGGSLSRRPHRKTNAILKVNLMKVDALSIISRGSPGDRTS